MLSFANIRKTKGHTVSMLLMFLIAALLLNAGLLVFLNFGSYFEKITKELNASDVYYIMPSPQYTEKVDKYIENNDNILEMQKEDSMWALASIPYNGDKRDLTLLFNDADKSRSLSKWKFVGEHLPTDSMSIYLPYVLSIDGGYKLNDKFVVTLKDTILTFTIKGFTEDTYFSSLDTGIMGAYLPRESYEQISQKLDDNYDTKLVFANLTKEGKSIDTGIRDLLSKEVPTDMTDITGTFFSIDLPLIKLSRTMMAAIVAIMIVAFAVIIAIVCLIVVRFRIGNSIEEDMTKIGSLKAIGYTSRQIVLSVVLQFLLTAFVGCVAGISVSYLATPVLSDVFAHQSGLMWVQGFDFKISSIALCAILIVVLAISFLSARRIHNLNPIVALRGGIITHNFRKNYLPLHKSKGRLPIVLAFKSMLQNKKQSIMIGFILVAVSFSTTFSFIMFYNTVIDTKAFAKIPGMEISNAIAVLNADVDNTKLVENIKNMSDVREVQFIDQTTIKIDDNDVFTYVMDDYSAKETNTVYEGRYPLHDNEIVIAGYLSEIIQKNIGESVTLKMGDKQADFIITGLSQGAHMGGMNASIRRDGFFKLNPNFKQQQLQIYLNKDVNADKFIKELEKAYKNSIIATIDMDKSMELGLGMYTSIVSKVGITMIVVMSLVVILVLYFVINSSIIRRKRELGIQKALGFTTLQLMNQLSIGFLPPIIVGVLIGSIVGITQTNALMTVAQRAMGIMKANYIITPVWIALFGVAIVIISYITSMLITYQIRKISAYALVSE